VSEIQQVGSIIEEITSATHLQSTGLSQASHSVMEIDQMTQQNAALVEQSAAAAASLSDQAHRLSEVVNQFRTDERGTHKHTLLLSA